MESGSCALPEASDSFQALQAKLSSWSILMSRRPAAEDVLAFAQLIENATKLRQSYVFSVHMRLH